MPDTSRDLDILLLGLPLLALPGVALKADALSRLLLLSKLVTDWALALPTFSFVMDTLSSREVSSMGYFFPGEALRIFGSRYTGTVWCP